MGRSFHAAAALLTLCAASPSRADIGALTIDVGGGGVATLLPAPAPSDYTLAPGRLTAASSAQAHAGVRYALSNSVEVTLSGFYEPAVEVFHNDVTLVPTGTPNVTYPGTLAHRYGRYGALAGARLLWGSIWRLTLGAELGWTARTYANLTAYSPGGTPYSFALRDSTLQSFMASAGVGVEWAFADKMSVAVHPRIQVIAGRGFVLSAALPITVSYSWYL